MAFNFLKPLLERLPENNRLERIWKLAQIDFMKRYYNDRLGVVWALLNPLFHITVYYFVFTYIFKSREENYVLFLTIGFLVWGLFSAISRGGLSILFRKKYLIQNIQFDKLDIFISHAISVFMGFAFNLFVYFCLALILGANINWNALYIIPLLFNVFLIGVAISMILSVLVLFIDDIQHLWDILIFVGFWGSGVLYDIEKVTIPPVLLFLNPFLSLLKNCRHALLFGKPIEFDMFAYTMMFGLVFFAFGIFLLRRFEHLILERG